MRKTKCLRCDARMKFGMQQKFQMGQTSFLLGDWPNLIAGALELEVWFCPKCGKVEFFVPGSTQNLPVKQPEPAQTEEFDYVGSMSMRASMPSARTACPRRSAPPAAGSTTSTTPDAPTVSTIITQNKTNRPE